MTIGLDSLACSIDGHGKEGMLLFVKLVNTSLLVNNSLHAIQTLATLLWSIVQDSKVWLISLPSARGQAQVDYLASHRYCSVWA